MNEELMREAGFGGGFNTYKVLKIDNGINIAGDEATGDLVEISYNDKDERQVKSYGKKLQGVIVNSKVVLTYRDGNNKIAESDEFNPMLNKDKDGAKALIPIFQLDFSGKRRKTPEGKNVVSYAFYDGLKLAKEQGVRNMKYLYTVVLYFMITEDTEFNGEIVKIKLGGASRGNFFNLQKNLWKNGKLKLPEAKLTLESYLETEYNKHAISFQPKLLEDGQVEQLADPTPVEAAMMVIIQEGNDRRNNFLPPSEQTMLRIASGFSTAPPQQETQAPVQAVPVAQEVPSSEPVASLADNQELPPVEAYNPDQQATEKKEDIPIY